jgi:hypothetical protein
MIRRLRWYLVVMLWAFTLGVAEVAAQERARLFAGVLTGIATLSADGTSVLSTGQARVSLYKPENGPSLNLLGGVNVREYVALQANYIWNRNDVTLASVDANQAVPSLEIYEQRYRSAQHALVGDVLVYFREQSSRLRPYLSGGIGVLHFRASPDAAPRILERADPVTIGAATQVVIRVAVGIDIAAGPVWRVRYSFSESVSGNPVSGALTPRGERGLANFQNLVGIVRVF